MLRLLFFVSLFCSLLLGCSAGAADTDSYIISKIESHSVSMEINYMGRWLTIGSGVAVKDKKERYILTAAHVASIGYDLPIRACSSKDEDICLELEHFLTTSDGSLKGDWALFPVEKLPKVIKPTKIRPVNLTVGTDVWQYGYPRGIELLSDGIISRSDDGIYWVQGFGYPGSSGGGVWDRRGRLVGIMVALPIWGLVPTPFGLLPGLITDQTLVVSTENLPL